MSELTVSQAMESIYASLRADNEELDARIAVLRAAMARAGLTEASFDPARLAQNNRQGRKLMQSYFRKRGVIVGFSS